MSEHNIWGLNNVSLNDAPTDEQKALMDNPCALVMARRIVAWSEQKEAKSFYRYLELVAGDALAGVSEQAMKHFFPDLVRTRVLLERRTKDGRGTYYVRSTHTWPWALVVLERHNKPKGA